MITDELLNKYIDNELSETELRELSDLLKNDSDAQARLKALKLTEEIVREIEIFPAPEHFTERFMSKITISTSVVKDKVSYFFIGMISVFALAIAGIIGFSLSQIEDSSSSLIQDSQYVQKTKNFFSEGLGHLYSLFSNDNMLLIGAGLTFILLISGYFILESHKNFKEKLNRFSH